ncbi:MAG: pantoate--beta-alanine ligase [Zetaproteobacteria bacterium]|nr:MAG: pantoate--beta-alanine ligase [Zetaproteobacteria bacterium]
MDIIRTQTELNTAISNRRKQGDKIGFVPTMGALHAGHISLIHRARQHGECVVVSIFVNPTQFAPHEDFDSYPRDEAQDAKNLEDAGVDILFLPTEKTLYPNGHDTDIKADISANGLETVFRPHFFDGVVNVVSRLFTAVKPDIAVFGEKDFQQLQVIKEMVTKENLPIEIIGAPIIRDKDGLALSSRNTYLSESELLVARQLNKILTIASQSQDIETAKASLLSAGFDKIDYVEMRWNRVLAAAWIGKTRLIDNISL